MKNNTSFIEQSEITIKFISNEKGFEDLSSAWRELYHKTNCEEAFLTWEWLFAWWKHHRDDKKLWLVTAWRDNKLCGIAPLMLMKRMKYGITFRSLTNIGFPDNDISGFIVINNDITIYNAIYKYIASRKKDWDLLEMRELPSENLEVTLLSETFQLKKYSLYEIKSEHFFLPIQNEWQAYFANLSKDDQGFLQKNLKRAQKEGKLCFKSIQGKYLTWEHFLTAFEVNKQSRHPHLYQQKEKEFLREVFNLTKEMIFFEVDILYLDEKPIAFNIGYTINKRHEGWRMGFDMNYHKIGPGRLMIMFLLQDFFTRELSEFDFLRGVEGHKNSWKPSIREFVDFRVIAKEKLLTNLTFNWLPSIKEHWNKSISRSNTSTN